MANTLAAHRHPVRASEQGLTLIEVMVSVLLLAILALGAFAAFSAQQTATSTQQRADTSLDAARSLMSSIGMQLRAAKGGAPVGYVKFNSAGTLYGIAGSPLGSLTTAAPPGANCATVAGQYQVPTIQVIDGAATGPDKLRILYPEGSAWGQTYTTLSTMASDSSIVFRTWDNTATTTVLPVLNGKDWVMVSDLASPATSCTTATAATACFSGFCDVSGLCVNTQTVLYQVKDNGANSVQAATACSGAATDFCFTTPASSSTISPYPFVAAMNSIPSGSGFLVRARWVEYAIDDSGSDKLGEDNMLYLKVKDLLSVDPTTNALTIAPAAEAIEDLQVALGYDLSNNGIIEPAEWLPATDTNVAGANACKLGPLLAVRVSIVARGTGQDERAQNIRPAVENRAAATAADGFFRVVLQSVIAFR
jgi:prepilin-type N-terminal cleavage/methylation domain-containing protein